MIQLEGLGAAIALLAMVASLSANENWEDDLEQLEQAEMFASPIIGYEGSESKLWKIANQIFSQAARDKALLLLKHENPVVRTYGYIFLSDRIPKEDFFHYLIYEIETKATVSTLIGDLQTRQYLADIVYQLLTKPLSDDQKSIVLDLLLRADEHFALLETALEKWEIPEKLHTHIRQRARNDIRFLLHVASWRQITDQDLIAQWHTNDRKEFWKAVSIYPAPEFLPLVESSLTDLFEDQQSGWEARVYFNAVTSYDNAISLPILRNGLRMMELRDSKEERGFFSGIVEALKLRDSDSYAEIEFAIWEKYNLIALNAWRRLIKLNPDRASVATVESLMKINKMSDEVTNSGEAVVPVMLEFSLSLPKDIRDPLFLHILQSASYSRARFLEIIAPAYSRQWSQILINRVATESNPHIFLPCAELLLSDPEGDHTEELRILQREKKHLMSGWGGEQFDSILTQKNQAR